MKWINWLAVAMVFAACGSTGDGQAPEPTTTTTTTTSDTSTSAETTTTTEVTTTMSVPEGIPQGVLDEILVDAADRTGAEASEVEVVSVESMNFSDTSLGCPEPGKMYAQVITPGYGVLVNADGEELDYRVAEDSEGVVLCEGGIGKFIPPRGPIGDY